MKKIIPKVIGTYLNTLALISPTDAASKAFALFCRPLRPKLNEKHLEYLAAAKFETFEHQGEQIQVYKWGSGKKNILFVHGWQSHTYRWKNYVDSFSPEEFTIYSIDAPGHGLSTGKFLTVPLYSSVIREVILRIEQVHTIVSHSIGSFSVLHAMHHYPLLPVEKIVLMAPPGEALDFVEVFRSTCGLSNRVVERVTAKFEELYDTLPDYYSSKKFAATVNQKGLIIHDEHDDEAPYRYAKEIHKAWAKSTLLTTKGFGHNLRDQSVTDAVKNFITENKTVSRTLEVV